MWDVRIECRKQGGKSRSTARGGRGRTGPDLPAGPFVKPLFRAAGQDSDPAIGTGRIGILPRGHRAVLIPLTAAAVAAATAAAVAATPAPAAVAAATAAATAATAAV